ncbi:MAG: MFS transporter [Promethearchaeota archaeon]
MEGKEKEEGKNRELDTEETNNIGQKRNKGTESHTSSADFGDLPEFDLGDFEEFTKSESYNDSEMFSSSDQDINSKSGGHDTSENDKHRRGIKKLKSFKEKFKQWYRKNFSRDISIERNAFVFLYLSAVNLIIVMGVILRNTWLDELPIEKNFIDVKGFELVISIVSLIIAIIISDKILKKSKFLNYMLLLNTIGLGIYVLNNIVFKLIGRTLMSIGIVFGSLFFIVTVIHESSILSRGRITAYIFFLVVVTGIFLIYFVTDVNLQFVLLIPLVLIDIILLKYCKYEYVENAFRLRGNVKFTDLIKSKESWGYFLTFLIIAFILGMDYLRYDTTIDVILIYGISLIMVLISGVLIDNMGRKRVLIGTIAFLGILTLFATENSQVWFWSSTTISIFYGILINLVVILFITYSGDSSRDEYRKLRGKIVGIYIIGIIIGFAVGNSLGVYIMNLYAADPVKYPRVPDMINKIGGFFIILSLIIVYPLKDTLQSKETNWFNSLRQLYIFNQNGICLYSYDFRKDIIELQEGHIDTSKIISQDLVSGGLTGIVSMIAEITQSNKRLRIVDQGDKKVLFHFGKYTIFALITTKYLNILVSKLRDFAKDFEDTFELALKRFNGNVSSFDATEFIIKKHFRRKFF